jgi:hypothetical protein
MTDALSNIDDLEVAPNAFLDAFQHFKKLIAPHDGGQTFAGFDQGVVAAEEGYKPRLRDHALSLLNIEQWDSAQIGTGAILERMIAAIEIQSGPTLTNNLVFWQNRFGPANRDHRALLEAFDERGERMREFETLLFALYRDHGDEGAIFDQLTELTRAKYPLLAYLYFLRDSDRFMPINPTTFDRAFRRLGVGLTTSRRCTWANYIQFNFALGSVKRELNKVEGGQTARLIDAHSFCWILEKFEEPGSKQSSSTAPSRGRVIGGVEKSIIAMRTSILNTVQGSYGQAVTRTVKDKQTDMSAPELDAHLGYLIEAQGGLCALSGLAFNYHSHDGDRALWPSPDRIDSSGQYVRENIQVVCQFINFWKRDQPDLEFRRLLALVRDTRN